MLVNVGRGMEIKTGVFTAPYSGQYSFHFNGFKDALMVDELHVALKLNGQTDLASSYIGSPNGGSAHLSPFFLHTIASLKAGDKVSLYLMEGSIAESIDYTGHGNNFFGFLLHQDLSFVLNEITINYLESLILVPFYILLFGFLKFIYNKEFDVECYFTHLHLK